MLWDERSAVQRATQTPSTGLPVELGMEALTSGLNFTQDEERSDSLERALYEEYDTYLDSVEQATGARLPNPIDVGGPGLPDFQKGRKPGEVASAPQVPSFEGSGGFPAFEERLKKARDLNPAKFPEPPTPGQLLDRITNKLGLSRERYQDIQSRMTTGGSVASMVGSMGALATDPTVLATLPFGAGAGRTLIQKMLIEAGLASAGELALQPYVFRTKEAIESPYTGYDVAANVALAGVFGAALPGAGALLSKGGSAAVKVLDRAFNAERPLVRPARPVERAALADVERQTMAEESSPTAPSDLPAHLERLDAEIAAVRETGAPSKLSESGQDVLGETANFNNRAQVDAALADVSRETGEPSYRQLSSVKGGEDISVPVDPARAAVIDLPDPEFDAAIRTVARDDPDLAQALDVVDLVRQRALGSTAIPSQVELGTRVAPDESIPGATQTPFPDRETTFLGVLRAAGGIRPTSEFDLNYKALGKAFPELVNKRGRKVDELVGWAREEGFIPDRTGVYNSERSDEVAELIDRQLAGDNPVRLNSDTKGLELQAEQANIDRRLVDIAKNELDTSLSGNELAIARQLIEEQDFDDVDALVQAMTYAALRNEGGTFDGGAAADDFDIPFDELSAEVAGGARGRPTTGPGAASPERLGDGGAIEGPTDAARRDADIGRFVADFVRQPIPDPAVASKELAEFTGSPAEEAILAANVERALGAKAPPEPVPGAPKPAEPPKPTLDPELAAMTIPVDGAIDPFTGEPIPGLRTARELLDELDADQRTLDAMASCSAPIPVPGVKK